MNKRYRLLLLLFVAPLFVALGDSSVWDANEAFYVQTPREMVESGNWIVPTFNGQPRLNKPPLSYWLVAFPYQWFGVSLWIERFVIALLAAATVLLVDRLGGLLFSPTVGILAAGIFASTFRFLILSRRLLIDILLLFCLIGAATAFAAWAKSKKPVWLLLCSLSLGLGFLAKGPVILLPGLVFVLIAFFFLGSGYFKPLQVTLALLVLVALSASWFVILAQEAGWQPVRDFFLAENLGRYVNLEYGPKRGGFYYVGVFLADFFPWSFFFVGAIPWLIRNLRRRFSPTDPFPPLVLLSFWIGVYFLVFSASYNKQEYYILPVYPAAAICLAAFFEGGRVVRWIPGVIAGLLAFIGAGLGILAVGFLEFSPLRLLLALLPLIMAILFTVRRRFIGVSVSLSLFYGALFGLYSTPLEAYKPVEPFSELIRREVLQEGISRYRAGYYRVTAPSLRFYLDRDIVELYETEEALEVLRSPIPTFLIVDESGLSELQGRLDGDIKIVGRRPKLYTTARSLLQGIRNGHLDEFCLRHVYLIRSH